MFRSLVVFYVFTSFSTASDLNQDTQYDVLKNVKSSQGALGFVASLSNIPVQKVFQSIYEGPLNGLMRTHLSAQPKNVSFYLKDENQIRIPTQIYDEYTKKKKIKTQPKRTIQKIIKKGKNKSRKIYVRPITKKPTLATEKIEIIDSGNFQDDDVTTGSPRKRLRKNSKVPRYPMPFHRLQSRKNTGHFRNRREVERDDVYIFKDLDEMEFVNRGKDYDIVKTHVKKYW